MINFSPVFARWTKTARLIAFASFVTFFIGCVDDASTAKASVKTMEKPENLKIATFGAGCFWCTEAVMEALDGVYEVESGYMGGHVLNPTYRQVCTGETGHAEVIQVHYDPDQISFDSLLDTFWAMHDPTTLNRQGADVGTQYRSAIFYHNDQQREIAESSKQSAQAAFKNPIVTEITEASTFYPAEVNHQDYYALNPNAGYCRMVIKPKLRKLGLDH